MEGAFAQDVGEVVFVYGRSMHVIHRVNLIIGGLAGGFGNWDSRRMR